MSKKKKIRIHSEPDTSEEGNETEKSNFDANQTKNPEPEKTENESLAPPDLLKELETVGADLDLTGLTQTEIDDLIRGMETPEEGLTDPDLVPEPLDEPATRSGGLIYLGRHRLLCGDCGGWKPRLISGDELLLANLELTIPDG